jgi:DNA recombination protein RmuC
LLGSYEIFLLGLIVGLVIGLGVFILIRVNTKKIIDEAVEQTQSRMKDTFGNIALEALDKANENFTRTAKETLSGQVREGTNQLEGKKELIDQSLVNMNKELESVKKLMTDLEADRSAKFGELSEAIRNANAQTQRLQSTAERLNQALSNSSVRGQWGERMADDILHMIGFVEGVNYMKQKVIASSGSKPDFTFMLPKDLKINMDVKFPFDNFLAYLDASTDEEKNTYTNKFLQDVRTKVKEISSREYINPEQQTLDFAIMFVPNQHVYEFINESDAKMFEYALKEKVILTSPMTLYSMLVIVRQSTDIFNLQNNINEILKVFGSFNKQWESFTKSFDAMGKKIQDTHVEFEKLTTTRKRMLESQLKKIESLRKERGLPVNRLSDLEESDKELREPEET